MATNSQETAPIVAEEKKQNQSSAPPAPAPAPAVKIKKPSIYEGDTRYAAFKIVNLRLLKEDTIQYDPNYPELILNTTAAEGMSLPLTPFFASRISQTLELVL
jgi:hypothetical protein